MKPGAIAAALRGGETAAGEPRRLAIYRNNVSSALSSALAVRYPVTRQIIGARRFAAIAATFADRQRPRDPVLIAYGESFPNHIRDSPLAAGVPYLADVAALESAWWRAYHAADGEPLRREAFAAIAPHELDALVVTFLPAMGIVASRWPILAIWSTERRGDDGHQVNMSVAESVLVARPALEVSLSNIDESTAGFLLALLEGRSLGDATAGVEAKFSGFDLTAALTLLIASGIVASIVRGPL